MLLFSIFFPTPLSIFGRLNVPCIWLLLRSVCFFLFANWTKCRYVSCMRWENRKASVLIRVILQLTLSRAFKNWKVIEPDRPWDLLVTWVQAREDGFYSTVFRLLKIDLSTKDNTGSTGQISSRCSRQPKKRFAMLDILFCRSYKYFTILDRYNFIVTYTVEWLTGCE